MSLDQPPSIRDIERMLARGRELRSAHLRYLMALAVRMHASVANRQRQRIAAILNHADPERRSHRRPRAAGIGARWHRP